MYRLLLPSEKQKERGALHSRKRTYKQGFVALVLAFLNFCWARGVNYKLSYFYLALLYSSCVRLQSEVIILIFQSTLWFFGSCLNCQKLAQPRPFNTRNNSSWIYCSDNLINFLFETNFRLLESPLFFVFISVLLKHRWRAFNPRKSLQSEYRLSELYTSKWVP